MTMFGPARGRRASQSDRKKGTDLKQIRPLLQFVRPYRSVVFGALVALTVSAAAVLAMGVGLRLLIDQGLGGNNIDLLKNIDLLNNALIYLIGMVVLLAASTFSRFYLVSWLGERVVADIRLAIFTRILRLSPAFFEINKTGELLSRITTDTTLLQTVIGSQASSALRNLLLLTGGIVMLFIFLPINVPLWKMVMELLGHTLPWGDLQLFFGFLVFFVMGGVLTFTPKLRSPFSE